MNYRGRVDMFVAFPSRVLARYVDLTMPKRDWSMYDAPAKDRVNVAKFRIQRAKQVATPALLRRQAS